LLSDGVVRVSESYPELNKSLFAPSVTSSGGYDFLKGFLCHGLTSLGFQTGNLLTRLRLWRLPSICAVESLSDLTADLGKCRTFQETFWQDRCFGWLHSLSLLGLLVNRL